MSQSSQAFTRRLEAVSGALRLQTGLAHAGLTPPDARTGEQWEAHQVWAHLAEFVPYWIAEIDRIRRSPRGDATFGRTKADPARIAAIETGRQRAVPQLWEVISHDLSELQGWLGGISDAEWSRLGTHPTLGQMSVAQATDEFLVGHLEEHLQQLQGLVSRHAD